MLQGEIQFNSILKFCFWFHDEKYGTICFDVISTKMNKGRNHNLLSRTKLEKQIKLKTLKVAVNFRIEVFTLPQWTIHMIKAVEQYVKCGHPWTNFVCKWVLKWREKESGWKMKDCKCYHSGDIFMAWRNKIENYSPRHIVRKRSHIFQQICTVPSLHIFHHHAKMFFAFKTAVHWDNKWIICEC